MQPEGNHVDIKIKIKIRPRSRPRTKLILREGDGGSQLGANEGDTVNPPP